MVAGVGVGCSLAILGFAHHLLLGPLPFVDADRLASLERTTPQLERSPISVPEFEDWQQRSRAFETLAMVHSTSFSYQSLGAPAERLTGLMVSWSMLDLLGLTPASGRDFLPEDDRREAPPVVLLGHAFWRARFAGSTDAIGRRLRLNGRLYTIVGILPAALEGRRILPEAESGDVWVPISLFFNRVTNGERTTRPEIHALGRLGDVDFKAAQSDMDRVAREIEAEYPLSNRDNGIEVVPLRERLLGSARNITFVLLGVAILVLAITGVDLGNLMLAQTLGRGRELATRQALGAGRGHIVRLLLAESVAVVVTGAAFGMILTAASNPVMRALMPEGLNRSFEPLAPAVWLAAVPLTLVLCLCSALPPLLYVTGRQALRLVAGPRAASGETLAGRKMRQRLVVIEVAVASTLLVASGLLAASLGAITDTDTGFKSDHLLTLKLSLDATVHQSLEQRLAFFDQLVAKVEAVPGVARAALTSFLPLDAQTFDFSRLTPQDRPTLSVPEMSTTAYLAVTPGYFEVMGIAYKRGRRLDPSTDRHGVKPPSVVISQGLAQAFWPDSSNDPTGRKIAFELSGTPEDVSLRPRTVVGVVADVHNRGLVEPVGFAVYVPMAQPPAYFAPQGWPSLALVVKTKSDPATLTSAIRTAAAEVAPEIPLFAVRTMDQIVNSQLSPRANLALVVRAFSILALVLAVAGVYGVIAAGVVAERREIGVRGALGAQPWQVLSHYLKRAGLLVASGLAIGLPIALVLAPRLLASVLFSVTPHAPLPYLASAAVLGICAFAAALFPALRATHVPLTDVLHDS